MLYTKSCALFHSKKCVTFYFCSSLFKIKRSKLTSARNATRTRLIDMYLSVLIFYYYICLSTRSFLGFYQCYYTSKAVEDYGLTEKNHFHSEALRPEVTL